MALCRRLFFTRSSIISNFSTSCSVCNKWRIEQGLESNPREYCVLNQLPDYSFLDGRPAILSGSKIRRLQYEQQICKRVVELTNEIDVGLQQYHEREEQKRKQKQTILKSKRKPKGAVLLKKNNKMSNSES